MSSDQPSGADYDMIDQAHAARERRSVSSWLKYKVYQRCPPSPPLVALWTVYPHSYRRLHERMKHTLFPPHFHTNVRWYAKSLASIVERDHFIQWYINMNDEQTARHAESIRDEAWAMDLYYPCFGLGWFTLPGLSGLDIWKDLVRAGREGKTILDFGCGLGENLRRLRAEVGNGPKLYATDRKREIWELGCKLFKDEGERIAEFLPAYPSEWYGKNFERLRGQIDVVLVCKYMEYREWHTQIDVWQHIIRLSHIGTQIIGYTFGDDPYSPNSMKLCGAGWDGFLHSPNSMKDQWSASQGSTKWNTEIETFPLDQIGLNVDDVSWLTEAQGFVLKGLKFVLTRTE